MKRKNIDTMREVRLWIRDIIIPAAGIVVLIPETRKAVVNKVKELKSNIEKK